MRPLARWTCCFVVVLGGACWVPGPASAQTPVDFSSWFAESFPPVGTFPGGLWTVAPDGLSVFQTNNGVPTFFCSDFSAAGRELVGVLHVEPGAGDDDFIGFAIGFNAGDTANPSADYLLVDWKRITQSWDFADPSCTPGSTALAGVAVSRVNGPPTADEFWGHVDFDAPACSPLGQGLAELQRAATLDGVGWAFGTAYTFELSFDTTSLRVVIDGSLELDVSGSFNDGSFCFYNNSQRWVTYEGFEVELTPCDPLAISQPVAPLCTGEAATLDGSTSVACDAAGLEYRWLDAATAVCDWSVSPLCDVTPPATTTYTLEVRCPTLPACAPTGLANVTELVEVYDWPVAVAGDDVTVCADEPLLLDASASSDPGCPGGLVFEWLIGPVVVRPAEPDPTWPAPTATPGSTTYTVAARCAAPPGCETTDDVIVTVEPCPLAVAWASWSAVRVEAGIRVGWVTTLEQDTLAFRLEARDGGGRSQQVAHLGARGPGHPYEWLDATSEALSGGVTAYRVVELTGDGPGNATPWFAISGTGTGPPSGGVRTRGRRTR